MRTVEGDLIIYPIFIIVCSESGPVPESGYKVCYDIRPGVDSEARPAFKRQLCHCASLGKLLNLFETQFPHLYNGDNDQLHRIMNKNANGNTQKTLSTALSLNSIHSSYHQFFNLI